MTVRRENPSARLVIDEHGTWWHEDPGDPNWIRLGFAPTPVGRWQTFWHHFHHGMLMGYGLINVTLWSLRNSASFA